MNLLPDPLHPAVVHFPIVLVLLGTAAALGSVFWRGPGLRPLTAILLVTGAVAAWAAVETGETDGGLLDLNDPRAEALVDAHQEWAQHTLMTAVVAAVAAVAASVSRRWPRISRGFTLATALFALTATWMVVETGHRGGTMVYRHGAGILLVPASSAVNGAGGPAPADRSRAEHDND